MVYPLVQYVGPAYATEPQVKRPTAPRELDARNSDGIDVRLLWHPVDDHVSVAVNDTQTGESFELPVRDGRFPGRQAAAVRLFRLLESGCRGDRRCHLCAVAQFGADDRR